MLYKSFIMRLFMELICDHYVDGHFEVATDVFIEVY